MSGRVPLRSAWWLTGSVALLLAACAAPTRPAATPAFDAAAMVKAIRAAGAAAPTELDVQPLRDPQVEDLREQATQLEARHMYRGAADLLDRAMQINAEDPALLQERAELALLLRDAATAQRLARQAIAMGSTTGPLCRRHWETLLQEALLQRPRTVQPFVLGGAAQLARHLVFLGDEEQSGAAGGQPRRGTTGQHRDQRRACVADRHSGVAHELGARHLGHDAHPSRVVRALSASPVR